MVEAEQTQEPEMVDQAESNHDAKKSPQESFAELRKAKEDLDRQLWQVKKEKEMLEQHYAAQHKAQQAPPEEEYDYRQLETEEFPDGKKLVKALNTFNKKMTGYEQQLAAKDQKIQLLETLSDPTMADFRQIVTAENIEKYIKSDEDYREAVEKAANPLRKVYNLLKKDHKFNSDMAQKAVKEKPISQEQQRVNDKESKPKTTSIGVRSEAISSIAATSNSRMTREQRNALWAETQSAARK